MLEPLPQHTAGTIGFVALGQLTDDDYFNVFLPALQEAAEGTPNKRVLIYAPREFSGWACGSAWEAETFAMVHKTDFVRLSMVCEPVWSGWIEGVCRRFNAGEARRFDVDQLCEGWRWASEQEWGPPPS